MKADSDCPQTDTTSYSSCLSGVAAEEEETGDREPQAVRVRRKGERGGSPFYLGNNSLPLLNQKPALLNKSRGPRYNS